jgi:hypothetical protein
MGILITQNIVFLFFICEIRSNKFRERKRRKLHFGHKLVIAGIFKRTGYFNMKKSSKNSLVGKFLKIIFRNIKNYKLACFENFSAWLTL